MSNLIQKYRRVLEQGFMPICVGDRFDIGVLAKATLEAGASAIEITCRRADARAEIQRVKREFPSLLILAGSTVDEGPLLQCLQRRLPQMPSIGQLLDAGVDGIVSALPLRLETITKLSSTQLVIPGVETPTEAMQAIEHGAHLAKLFTADLMGGHERVRRLTCAATHGLLPLFVTGGITGPRIADYLDAGVTMLGSGWDVLLGAEYRAMQDHPDPAKLTLALKNFLDSFQSRRATLNPMWSSSRDLSDQQFLQSLAHYVPQNWITQPEKT